jgi:hypothetical protein
LKIGGTTFDRKNACEYTGGQKNKEKEKEDLGLVN